MQALSYTITRGAGTTTNNHMNICYKNKDDDYDDCSPPRFEIKIMVTTSPKCQQMNFVVSLLPLEKRILNTVKVTLGDSLECITLNPYVIPERREITHVISI